ncbi:MAG TPA: hypothetical protein VGP82_22505 [Ktedonobacterales bacterium]|nr:hypothetical protein [Ktedonobacterales bacterium]
MMPAPWPPYSPGAGAAGDLDSMTYCSSDNGGHWRRVPGNLHVEEVASVAGKTYALFVCDATHAEQRPPGLVVSADGLQSWQPIHPVGYRRAMSRTSG